ncbi:MAG: glyoxylase-like metal-dependent hydrolase (beta-lactamase superfamily II) [Gammaproteobacteria bacterium]|jgi:glyoxylase-like metal-dependent hydrolase (beta-lactamase superfamily II)
MTMKHIIIFLFAIVANTSFAQTKTPDLQIKEIDNDVYLHTSFKQVEGFGLVDSNGLIVLGDNHAFIIDTPWSRHDTETLLDWINEQGFDLKASISTHFHDDRTAGIELLNSKSIPTYTSKLTHDLLVGNGMSTATNIFNSNEFSLQDGHIKVFYPGAGHTEDNLVVWLPQKGILYGGCLVRSLGWDSLGYIGDASVESWADSIRIIISKYSDIITVIPGHGKIGNTKILEHTIKLAETASNISIQTD